MPIMHISAISFPYIYYCRTQENGFFLRAYHFKEERRGSLMANMMALNNVYNHYLVTYSRGTMSKYDTHKKSELRGIYNSIVKMNKEAPLYLLNIDRPSQAFAVDIKEGARELHHTIASLGGLEDDELLNKKVASSSNENIVSAQYIGSSEDTSAVPSYDIEVKALASPQVNHGVFLPADEMKLPADTYSFDININNMSYEFQYNITDSDTNRSVQEKLSRLINRAGIGIEASVAESEDGTQTALRLSSSATGAVGGRDHIFSVSDHRSSKASGSVDYFGIGEITRPPANAEFVINGIPRSAFSNHFTVEKIYELTLNGISPTEGETATISLRNDVESLGENINQLVKGYNSFIQTAASNATEHTKGSSLVNEMRRLSYAYIDNLSQIGMKLQDDGTLTVDKSACSEAFENGDMGEPMSYVKDFANSLMRKTSQISLNPMQYVNKTIVAYKNPGRNFATPYITSAYSGMMFNSYC